MAAGTIVLLLAAAAGGYVIWADMDAVRSSAASLSAGRSYCIQTPTGERDPAYAPLRSRLATNPWSMRAPSGDIFPHWTFHAVLVVDDGTDSMSWYNWSYGKQAFVPIRAGTRDNLKVYPLEPRCRPKKNFLPQLPFISR